MSDRSVLCTLVLYLGLAGMAIASAFTVAPDLVSAFSYSESEGCAPTKALDLSRDPVLGETLDQGTLGRLGKLPVTLVLGGSCTECVAKTLLGTVKSMGEGNIAVVVTEEPDGKAWRKSLPSNVRVLTDAGWKLHRQLNAIFTPRAYGVERNGSLGWIQKVPGRIPNLRKQI